MLPLDSKPINLTAAKTAPGKPTRKRQIPRVLWQYVLLLAFVTIAAALFFGIFILVEQKRFFRMEASSYICYHPEKCPDMIPRLSIQEVLQIIRNDAVKQQVGDIVVIPQDKQKHLKEALDISCDTASDSQNMLKIRVKWNDADEARQLVDGYIQTAITAYCHFQINYLLEILKEQDKTKAEYEHEKTAIEEKLSKLAQSIHGKSMKQELETLRMHGTDRVRALIHNQRNINNGNHQFQRQ